MPAAKGSLLKEPVVIPIDQQGRTFVPFARAWNEGFQKVEAHALLQFFEDEDLRGNLLDLFEDSYVFIGDVSTGTSDLGQTPLEKNVPLSVLHTSMLNGLLTGTFYDKWKPGQVLGLLWGLGLLLGLSALPRASGVLYAAGTASVLGLIGLSWFECLHFRLVPVVTLAGGALLVFFGIVMVLQIAVSRERAFIRNAFSKYIPEKVVSQLLAQPERLRLGGEERVATVLFSDLANFTTFSEKMSPADLVRLINAYLTEMTDLVIQESGIIDKYEGDAIMAEFGVPLDLPDHADAAVRCALRMQERLEVLREAWSRKGLPEIRCRIGINTGPMIVGNMGSQQVFDYTVMGDAVNLAARLEAANKRYGTFLMISEATRLCLTPGLFCTRILDVIRVKGKTEAVTVHEVYAATAQGPNSLGEAYYLHLPAGL